MIPPAALEQHLNHGAPECSPASQFRSTFWTHPGCVQGWNLCLKWILLLLLSRTMASTGGKRPCLDREGTVGTVKHDGGREHLLETRAGAELRKDEDLGSHFICWAPQESLAANVGLWAVGRGSSSAGAGRHIWKQTFGLRLEPMCQVWCVSGKACCKDHHPWDWGGESGKSQMTEKTC